jgi:pimeloyl-ACP methyl ester carboxylesterase
MRHLAGDWVGGIDFKDTRVFVKVHFKTERKATVDIPQEDMVGVPSVCEADSSHVYIETLTSDPLTLRGHIKDNVISGDSTRFKKRGTFQLFRAVHVDPGVYKEYFGTYNLSDRLLVFGQRWGGLAYLEERTVVEVTPLSENTFFSERGEILTFKEKILILQVNGLEYTGTRTTLYKEEDITFSNRNVQLSGVLAVPLSKGPHPAVVLIHGSGAESREGYRFLADYLARHGIAALRYDKRGVGVSTGDWHYSTLEDLAEDALAGIHFLKQHQDIQKEKIGLIGTSQGAWVAPLTASNSEDAAFIVLISGAAVSPKIQELYRVSHELLYRGYSTLSIRLHLLSYRLQLLAAQLLQAVEKVIPLSRKLPKEIAFAVHIDWDFDPVPYLETVNCPVLAIYGELDKTVPVKESVPLMEKALKDKNATIKIFPRGNHALLESESGVWSEVPRLKKKEFVSGYYDLICDWITTLD